MNKIAVKEKSMISISGNSRDIWLDSGFENHDSFLAVNSCGYQKLITKNLERKREKGRVDYQLIYIVSGKGIFNFGNTETEVPEGNIVVYTPGQPQYYSYYAKDLTEVYWLHFTGFSAGNYIREFGFFHNPVYSVGVFDEAVLLYKKIINELNLKKPLNNQIASAYLLELLSLFGRKLQSGDQRWNSDAHGDIKKIIETMHEKYSQGLIVSRLAEECGLSLFRFIHKFKTVTGMTPVEYITAIRINEAKKLLLETSLNVGEVASIVGYDNPLYFSRVFKKAVGIPPKQYKR